MLLEVAPSKATAPLCGNRQKQERLIMASPEKKFGSDSEKGPIDTETGTVEPVLLDSDDIEQHEVFQKNIDGVEFRTVGWPRASVIFLKSNASSNVLICETVADISSIVIFATGVLSIPTAMYSLGMIP